MRNLHQSIPDRSRPGLPTTASGVAQQDTCGNYATAKHCENKSRERGVKRVKKQREAWKGRRSLIRVGTLNIETMTGRATTSHLNVVVQSPSLHWGGSKWLVDSPRVSSSGDSPSDNSSHFLSLLSNAWSHMDSTLKPN